MYLLGFDIGSSSIKAALFDADNQKVVAVIQEPSTGCGTSEAASSFQVSLMAFMSHPRQP